MCLLVRQLRNGALGTGTYADPAGDRGLRQAIARHIAISRGVQTSPEDIAGMIETGGLTQRRGARVFIHLGRRHQELLALGQ